MNIKLKLAILRSGNPHAFVKRNKIYFSTGISVERANELADEIDRLNKRVLTKAELDHVAHALQGCAACVKIAKKLKGEE